MKNKGQYILNKYILKDCLITPPIDSGLPQLFSGSIKEENADVIIKIWPPNKGKGNEDLEIIWRNEIRLLQRLAGYPGGRDYLTTMLDAGHNTDGFYLILKSDQKLPLGWYSQQSSLGLSSPVKKMSRNLLWKNMRRLAQGLSILHLQGVIHRNLDEWSVFSAGDDSPDFQLGGFEWGIRLRSSEIDTPATFQKVINKDIDFYSFSHDWKLLGKLICGLLGVDVSKLFLSTTVDELKPSGLSIGELALLQDLVHADSAETEQLRLDYILDQIDEIIFFYEDKSNNSGNPLCLLYDSEIQAGDWPEIYRTRQDKIDFLRNDISSATFHELKAHETGDKQFVLYGARCVYYLKKYFARMDWKFVTIKAISLNNVSKNIKNSTRLPEGKIKVYEMQDAEEKMSELLLYADEWDQIFSDVNDPYSEKSRSCYDSLALLHLIETLYSLATNWPIVIKKIETKSQGNYIYTIEYAEDEKRETLSSCLGLDSLFNRLIEEFDKCQSSDLWQVSEKDKINNRTETDKWLYIGSVKAKNGSEEKYRFSGNKYFSEGQKLILRTFSDEGQDELVKRRTALLKKLKEYAELTEVLSQPLSSIRASHDNAPCFSNELDDAKIKSLRNIFNSLPIYLLQGPPGVGKTRLITELVKVCFSNDPLTRMLVTAQGHDAVNHLMEKICSEMEKWPDSMQPMIVRSRNKKGREIAGNFHIKNQAINLLDTLSSSNLFKSAPINIREKIIDLKSRVETADDDARLPDAALESLLLRSANIVFSTTNSLDLKNMLDASAQFDWSIIEEAGRATGIELLASLMLSHRRLLIGDPKQLPPFGEDKLQTILKNPEKLQKAFECGRFLLGKSLNDLGIDELIDRYSNPVYRHQLTDDVRRALLLFESIYQELCLYDGKYPVTGFLNEQYRMHPGIANIVSKLFYSNKLMTSQKVSRERLRSHPPIISTCKKRIPDSPVVFIDMPWGQTANKLYLEKMPAYRNAKEQDVVVELLSLLRRHPTATKPPSIAVITPYNEQVTQLSAKIRLEREKRLSNLDEFDAGRKLVHTIDSFQGCEADVVVVSLVRNNSRGYYKGLGILSDARRMNVLLSRAKWKLIIIGSLDFLRNRFPRNTPIPQNSDLYFLKKFTQLISDQKHLIKAKRISARKSNIAVVLYKEVFSNKR